MVKRLRRRPLTAKTGVRVPMEVPNHPSGWFLLLWGRERAGSEWKPSGLPEPALTEPAGENSSPHGGAIKAAYAAFFF